MSSYLSLTHHPKFEAYRELYQDIEAGKQGTWPDKIEVDAMKLAEFAAGMMANKDIGFMGANNDGTWALAPMHHHETEFGAYSIGDAPKNYPQLSHNDIYELAISSKDPLAHKKLLAGFDKSCKAMTGSMSADKMEKNNLGCFVEGSMPDAYLPSRGIAYNLQQQNKADIAHIETPSVDFMKNSRNRDYSTMLAN